MSRFAEADRLLRLIVLERRRCERCGALKPPADMDTAHIIRRRYNATRCDERNVWLLCHEPCHRLVDNDAQQYDWLVRETIGWGLHAELREKAHLGTGIPLSGFWPAERARLRDRCRELGLSVKGAA